MGKKHRRQQAKESGVVRPHSQPAREHDPEAEARQDPHPRRVLFAVGDADFGYTEGKIWRLAHRLKEHTGWQVRGITNEQEVGQAGERLGLEVQHVAIDSPGVSMAERLQATDTMIRDTADVLIPGTTLPLWKVLAMDDFLSSLQLFGAQPSVRLEADLVIVPLMGVDNNTRGTAGLYTWLVSQAHRQHIPTVALEVSPLGNKNTLCHLPATHYVVKSEWSRNFLVREELALSHQVSVLRWEEAYLLWSGQDEFTEAYLEKEARAREILQIGPDRFVILIPHHVAFLWEVRQILAVLAQVPERLSVIVRVDPHTSRRQYPERELVLQTYDRELRTLPHVVIDERVGVGLLLQLADLIIAPLASTVTERAGLCRKPTIICQAMGEEGWQGECLYWEPEPTNIPGLIQAWRDRGLFRRIRLAELLSSLLDNTRSAARHRPPAADLAAQGLPHRTAGEHCTL